MRTVTLCSTLTAVQDEIGIMANVQNPNLVHKCFASRIMHIATSKGKGRALSCSIRCTSTEVSPEVPAIIDITPLPERETSTPVVTPDHDTTLTVHVDRRLLTDMSVFPTPTSRPHRRQRSVSLEVRCAIQTQLDDKAILHTL